MAKIIKACEVLIKVFNEAGMDVINHIASYLTMKDIHKLHKVCKTQTEIKFPHISLFEVPLSNIKPTGMSSGIHDNTTSLILL